MDSFNNIVAKLKFNAEGLIPAIAQQHDSNEILMMAWMNKESVVKTLSTKQVFYYSRSRSKLWRKGESSGQIQMLKEMLIDCDGDTILLKVDQHGVACHTGRRSCFFSSVQGNEIIINQEISISPDQLYES